MPVPVPLVLPVATHHPTWPPRRRSRCLTRLWHPPPSSASSKPPARAAGASGWSVTHILSPRDTEPPQPTPTKPIGTPPTTPTTTTTTREPSPCPEHPVGAAGPGGSRLPPAHGGEHEASGVSQSVCPVSSRPPPPPPALCCPQGGGCGVLQERDGQGAHLPPPPRCSSHWGHAHAKVPSVPPASIRPSGAGARGTGRQDELPVLGIAGR